MHSWGRSSMEEFILQAIKQDIEGAVEAYRKENFELMNILANRIMSDALFVDDGRFALPGFFLKDVASGYLRFKRRWSSPDATRVRRKIKQIGERYISTFLGFDTTTEEIELWQNFHDYDNKIREFITSDIERSVYNDNPAFAHSVFLWLLRYLGENKNLLFDTRVQLLNGILNEMERIRKVYNCTLADTYAACLLIALKRYFDYFSYANATSEGKIPEKEVVDNIFPFIEDIMGLALHANGDIEPERVRVLLWRLIKGWREYYIKYTDLPPREIVRPLELPDEFKETLRKSIKSSLEREAKPK